MHAYIHTYQVYQEIYAEASIPYTLPYTSKAVYDAAREQVRTCDSPILVCIMHAYINTYIQCRTLQAVYDTDREQVRIRM